MSRSDFMAKKRSVIADYAVYLLVRLLVCIVQAIPFRLGPGVGSAVAWLVYQVDRRHRLVAADNLRQAFPGELNEGQVDALVRSVYRHFCTLAIEIVHLPRRMHANNWQDHLELAD